MACRVLYAARMKTNKLTLKTETLRALTAAALDSVRGGDGFPQEARSVVGMTCQYRSGFVPCKEAEDLAKKLSPAGAGGGDE